MDEKKSLIVDNIIRCVRIDTSTSTFSHKPLKMFKSALNKYIFESSCEPDKYNPLLLIFEVVMLLMDKGYNKPLNKKDKTEKFHALKIFLDSPKVFDPETGCYMHKYGVHIGSHSEASKLLETIFHELTHALCKIIYNDTATSYRDDLEKLAAALKEYYSDKANSPSYLNFFYYYSKKKYAKELFPRLVELYIKKPNSAYHLSYPYHILVMINRLFSQFIRDVAEFKLKLIELQTENKWSRVAISKALEHEDYKTYFSMVTPATQSSVNEWPQFSDNTKLVSMAVAKDFSLYSLNKFKKNILQIVLEAKRPNIDRGLDILEKIWEAKGEIPVANLNVCNEMGLSLLSRAIIQNKEQQFIKWLIVKAGVDVSIIDGFGKNALYYAELMNLEEVHQLIKLFLFPCETDVSQFAVS